MVNYCRTLIVIIFVMSFSFLQAQEFPKYQMVDLGVFETDESEALVVNEKGQVLGRCVIKNQKSLFLWDKNWGLKFIEIPYEGNFKLNNRGQIAGVYQSNGMNTAFFWDPVLGLFDLAKTNFNLKMDGMNDSGQILLSIQSDKGNRLIVWENGKVTDLGALFHEKVPGEWIGIEGVSINNQGDIAIITSKKIDLASGQAKYVTKSFLFSKNIFQMVLPEKNPETNIVVSALDDYKNMIVAVDEVSFFLKAASNVSARLQRHWNGYMIHNQLPVEKRCLPGKLQKDINGELYYGPGIMVIKLLKEEHPYYDIKARSTLISGQNSKGYFVGRVNTLYPGRHAFLAIPALQ